MATTRAFLVVTGLVLGFAWWWGTSRKSSFRETLYRNYDYIIVGAGTAGCVLANRLSADPNVSVLLLEAGEETSFLNRWAIQFPVAAITLQRGSFDWKYETVPQKHACVGSNNNVSFWARGKGLGGTSSINYMMYSRGSRHDYNQWEELGCSGWSYANVLPYFLRSESVQIKELLKSQYHGHEGPVTVSDDTYGEAPNIIIEAAKQLGYKEGDLNGETDYGFMRVQSQSNKGLRQTMADAYLTPVLDRPNLHVMLGVHVSKVLFEDKRAVGIEYIHKDKPRNTVSVKKEVIVSAGTIGSPHLLMLSGIGPKSHLQDLQIPVVADLPVGDNLQDHVMTDAPSFETESPLVPTTSEIISFSMLLQYFYHGLGYLASPVMLAATGLINTKLSTMHNPSNIEHDIETKQAYEENKQANVENKQSDVENKQSGSENKQTNAESKQHSKDIKQSNTENKQPYLGNKQPDVQYFAASVLFGGEPLIKNNYLEISNMKSEVYNSLYGANAGKRGLQILTILLHPKSHGRIRLKSIDPLEHPIIDPQYLSHQEDIETLIDGIENAMKLEKTSAFEEIGAKLVQRTIPGCEGILYGSRAYWECYVRQQTLTVYHPVGTCKMGHRDDPTAVLDPQLRVKGVIGLRVADASIMPKIISGNTNAAVTMIAEKASDMILSSTS
ncbi:unnamed protein product [Owenia fusiformis]|uniref:Uncharacterized protein n=1 Tax=Owenia fusiformis TaxID=6347 RepID=A0A8J1TAA7_OWEFU|nr:unnamed protein product [Owenia fusiformis]